MTEKREHLLTGNIFKLMLELSVPAIIGMLVISLYNFVDGIFVGKCVGKIALGAISLAYAFTLFNNGIAVLVGMGSAATLSRAIGRQDQKTIDAIMGNVVILTIIFSTVVMILVYIFAPQLLSLIGAEGEMLELGVKYLRIVYLASIFVNFGQAANMVMRGEGQMILAMTFMGASAVLNIILDAVFVAGLKMGIEGAAIATIISQIELGISLLIYFKFFSKNLKLKKIKLEKSIIGETLSVGISGMMMQVFAIIQQAVMYATLKKYGGENQVILMSAFFRYLMLSFIPLWGISQGFQPFAGTNFGAKQFERLKKGTLMFCGFALTLALIFWIAFMTNPTTILGWFLKDSNLVAMGKTNTQLAMVFFPLSALMIINLTFFQSIKKAKPAGILVMARQIVLYIPAVLLLPLLFGVRGVWISSAIVDTIVSVISIIIVINIFRKDLKTPIKTVANNTL